MRYVSISLPFMFAVDAVCIYLITFCYIVYSMRTSNFLEGAIVTWRARGCIGLGVRAIRVDLHFIEKHLHTIQSFAHVP